MATCIIYGLADPRTGEIRYIGKSACGTRRTIIHRTPSSLAEPTRKNRWIRSLHKVGLTYEVTILARPAPAALDAEEKAWIARGRALGWRLTNATDGGDGQSRGYRTPDHVKQKLSAALKGRGTSADTRAKLAAATRKCWQDAAFRERQVARLKAVWRPRVVTAEERARMSEASRASWATEDGRARRLAGCAKGLATIAARRNHNTITTARAEAGIAPACV